MLRLLVDTCVWLDLAKDHRQERTLSILEELVRIGELSLVVPAVVREEFQKHKSRIIEESRKSLSTVIRRVKDAVDRFGAPEKRAAVLEQLSEVDHQLPLLGEACARSVSRIDTLLAAASVVSATPAIMARAAERGLKAVAPFHRQRNGIADSVIFETYLECLAKEKGRGLRFCLVTHNVHDFSDPIGDNRKPHPAIAPHFSKVKSLYYVNLAEALKRLRPKLVTELMLEYEDSDQPCRSLAEVLAAIDKFTDMVWYDRHQMRAQGVKSGRTKVIDRKEWSLETNSSTMVKDIWAGALRAAKAVEKQYGKKNLGPWTDFEWGMLNGKLSALRWFIGYEWDMLDT